MKNVQEPRAPEGPCTEYAKRTMPAGEGHDHMAIDQHRFKCEMETVAFDAMTEQFAARPDVVFGEMDVKGDLAVVAIAYPESGFVLFDVSDSSKPKFLSWYRGDECEGLAIDVDCGAFVDLSPDGKRVYVSIQHTVGRAGRHARRLGPRCWPTRASTSSTSPPARHRP